MEEWYEKIHERIIHSVSNYVVDYLWNKDGRCLVNQHTLAMCVKHEGEPLYYLVDFSYEIKDDDINAHIIISDIKEVTDDELLDYYNEHGKKSRIVTFDGGLKI
jgi:hypothetical protein